MIKDKNLTIQAGDNSENYQAETINQYGISYGDAKDIALDVFNNNIEKLTAQAKQVASERAQEVTELFLSKLQEKDENLLNSLQDPSMQLALYSAQKSYVRSGDKDVADLLVDILAKRAEQDNRNLLQIVLDESLEIVPKLTIEQLNALTVVFFFRYFHDSEINNLENLNKFLEQTIRPFAENITKEDSCYQHLEYCNCGTVNVSASVNLAGSIRRQYTGLFCTGVDLTSLEKRGLNIENFSDLIKECLHNNTKVQFSCINNYRLKEEVEKRGLSQTNINDLFDIVDRYTMNEIEIKDYLISQKPFMSYLWDVWESSYMKNMTLTSVGIALAQANATRITGESFDLSIWIK